MAKYKVKYVGKIEWERVIDIQNENDPYKEAEEIIEKQNLAIQDGFVDDAHIEIADLRPIPCHTNQKRV